MAVAAARAAPRPSRLRAALRSDHVTGWAFVLPAVILVGAFAVVPLVWSFVLSFQKSNLVSPATWVGLHNYRQLAHDPVFFASVRRTVIFTGLFVPITLVASLALAKLLDRSVRGIGLYRLAVFLPVVTSTVATAVVFVFLLDRDYGIVNSVLGGLGFAQQGFLQDPGQALYAIVGIVVWHWVGFGVIIFLAALQGIPQEVVEAAQMDGATRWRTFRRVELPLLGPAILFLLVWLTIESLQLFDEIYVTTPGGGLLQSTTVVVFYLYQQAFNFFHAGYATAIAYVLFLATAIISAVQFWLSRKVVHYQ
jgi:multiple sugar transport system permease protein